MLSVIENLLPIEASYRGYNYELYFAITAPIIGFLVQKQRIQPKYVIAWNVLGIAFLLVVVSIVASAYYAPTIWGQQMPMVDNAIAQMPMILLPAFMVPSAILMHVFSILQQTRSPKEINIY